jgi:hypothetical protein
VIANSNQSISNNSIEVNAATSTAPVSSGSIKIKSITNRIKPRSHTQIANELYVGLVQEMIFSDDAVNKQNKTVK